MHAIKKFWMLYSIAQFTYPLLRKGYFSINALAGISQSITRGFVVNAHSIVATVRTMYNLSSSVYLPASKLVCVMSLKTGMGNGSGI